MVHRGTKIPTFHSMGCPRAYYRRLLMYDGLCARRGERRGVVVERSMQLCIPGKFGVHAIFPEQVEHEDGVWDKSAPEMKREVLVRTGKSRYEAFLDSSDCLFC